MRITQGCFSFLPDLTDDQITRQIQYCLEKNWAVNIEFTDDPHPRNTYWEMWGLPMFDLRDAACIMNRPKEEPGFRLDRQESVGRNMRYTTRTYAADRPEGERYQN